MMFTKPSYLHIFPLLASLYLCQIPLQAAPITDEPDSAVKTSSASSEGDKADKPNINSAYGKFYITSVPLWEANFQAVPNWMRVNNQMLCVGSAFTKRVSSYDTASGLLLWNFQLPAPAAAPPLFSDNTLTLTTKDCSIVRLKAISGEVNSWILPFPYDHLIDFNKKKTEHTGETGIAAALSNAKRKAEYRRFKNQLLRLNLGSLPRLAYSSPCFSKNGIVCLSGDGIITQVDDQGAKPNWNLLKCGSLQNKLFVSTPTVICTYQKELLCAVTLDGQLWIVDLQNTEKVYQQTIGKSNMEFRSPVRLIKDLLYFTAMDGTVFCYALNSTDSGKNYLHAKLIWKSSLPNNNIYQVNSEGYFIGAPSFDFKKPRCFVVKKDSRIISLSSLSGRLLWSCKIPGTPASPALYWNGNVLAATEQKALLVLDAETGRIKKEYQLPFVPFCPLVIGGNNLYIISKDGRLACFEIKNNDV
ncbi:MAG: PQQ-binding-like beta-propeller repeat protein [Candidatus Bruticola sp.]